MNIVTLAASRAISLLRVFSILSISFFLFACANSSGTTEEETNEPDPEEPDSSEEVEIRSTNGQSREGDPGDSFAVQFIVSLSRADDETVTVNYASQDVTATAGDDYTETSGTLTFAPGETSKRIKVPVVSDVNIEDDESFELQFSNASNATLKTTAATGVIRDDETATVSISNGSISETDSGSNAEMPFTLSLDKARSTDITVQLASQNGTAIAGEDFAVFNDSVTISAGSISAPVAVTITGDDLVEGDETFTLIITNASGAQIGQGSGTGTIIDQDTAVRISIDDAVATEGDDDSIALAVQLDRAVGHDVTVAFASEEGSAEKGSDYTLDDGTLTITAGAISADIVAQLVNDDTEETSEQFSVKLSAADTGIEIVDDTGVATILDDDGTPPPESLDAEILPQVATADRCDMTAPEYCMYPWPNDWFTTENDSTDTGKLLNLNILSTPKNTNGKPVDPTEWNRNDGFSPGQMMLTVVPGLTKIDALQDDAPDISNIQKSLNKDSAIFVIDAETSEFHPIWAEVDTNITKVNPGVPGGTESNHEGPALIMRPAINFKAGREYIAVMQRIRDDAGTLVEASPAFQVCRDGIATQLPQVTDRCTDLEPKIQKAVDLGVVRAELFSVWSFTVASERNLTERALHIRDHAFSGLGDTNLGNMVVEGDAPEVFIHPTIEKTDDHSIRLIRGRVTVPLYLNNNGVPGSTFNYEPDETGIYGDGLPDQALGGNASWDVAFICRISPNVYNGAASVEQAEENDTGITLGKMSLYGHGLIGSRDEVKNSSVHDFSRAYPTVFCAVDWIGMAFGNQPDDINDPNKYEPAWDFPGGDASSIVSILTDISNFDQLVDRAQQGFLNFMFLGRAMLHPDGFCSKREFQYVTAGASEPQCILDTTELFYDGNSQGGIMGGALLALSPDLRAGALGVPGMNYSTLLRRSVDFDDYAIAMYNSYTSSLDQSLVLSMIQNIWDRAESNGYAHHISDELPNTPPKRALLHPAFGDHQVTIWSAEVQARTYKARLHCPGTVDGTHPDFAAQGYRHSDDQNGTAFWGFDCLDYNNTEHTSGSALIMWDSGSAVGSPPLNNVPPRPEEGFGDDPHSDPRKTAIAIEQKWNFLAPNGKVINVCGDHACASNANGRTFDPTQ